VRGVLPVVRVDDRTLGDGRPGPMTRQVMDRYEQFLGEVARAEV